MDTDTTIRQLGGNQIFAMAFSGATASEDALTLHIAPALTRVGMSRATHVVVDASDTYSVEVLRITRRGRIKIQIMANARGLYGDMLRNAVESLTGLRLTLGTMGGAQ